MPKRMLSAVAVVLIALAAAPSALASPRSERQQNANISQALTTARSARKSADSANRSVKSLRNFVTRLASLFGSVIGQVNSFGSVSPELGVVTLYAGNGPPTPTSAAPPLSPIATAWSGQIPRGGNNAADATGTTLYNCTGPAANPSAGCDIQLRAVVRTTRPASQVNGTAGGGFVITGIKTTGANDATGAYAGARTGNGSAIANDPVGAVAFKSTAPMNSDGTPVTFTPGIGNLVGIESDHTTIHLQNPGLYEITGTLQFFDTKSS